MRKVSRVLVAALLAAGVVIGPFGGPAQAADVSITFTATGTNGSADTHAVCELTVADDADGVDVLDTAVEHECIGSYATESHPDFGTFVTEIDGVEDGAGALGVNCFFWVYFVNGAPATTGVDGYDASDGDVVSWVLEPFGSPVIDFC